MARFCTMLAACTSLRDVESDISCDDQLILSAESGWIHYDNDSGKIF